MAQAQTQEAQERFKKAWHSRVQNAAREYPAYRVQKVTVTSVDGSEYHGYQVKRNILTRNTKKEYPNGFIVLLGMTLRPDLKFRENPDLNEPETSHFITLQKARINQTNVEFLFPENLARTIPIKNGALITPVSSAVPSEFSSRIAVSCTCPDFVQRGSGHTTTSLTRRKVIEHGNLYGCKHMMMVNKFKLDVDYVPLELPNPWLNVE